MCRVCDECFDVLTGVAPKEQPKKNNRLSTAGGSMQSLHDTAEAQKNLAKRATKIFGGREDRSDSTYTASYMSQDTEVELASLSNPSISQTNTSENSESARSSQKEPRKKKKKKRRKVKRRNTISDLDDSDTRTNDSQMESDESEDSDSPDFAPPAPPPPQVNAEGFFDFDSEDEDELSDEFLPPPEREPPMPPGICA